VAAVAARPVGFLEIGRVARELGVSPSTLRSWERRYRLVVPHRGASGQRLYDADQLRLLRLVQAQILRGARAGAAHKAISRPGPALSQHVELVPAADAPRNARRAADAIAEAAGCGRFGFFLRLVTSELVSNAVLHGRPDEPIRLDLDLFDGWVQVRVENAGNRLRLKSLRRRRTESGRGLDIVDALADAWSIDAGPHGTTVAARLRVH
jgi:DNA-binding transcriptional MerR regulator